MSHPPPSCQLTIDDVCKAILKGNRTWANKIIRSRQSTAEWFLRNPSYVVRALRESELHDKDIYEYVVLVLNHGADINDKGHMGNTPLHEATKRLPQGSDIDYSLVALLVQRGADVNATNAEGFTPLHNVFDGHDNQSRYEVVPLLLRSGADLSIRTPTLGRTPLHNALIQTKKWPFEGEILRAIELLLEFGARLDTNDYEEKTPLHLAAATCSLNVIKLLVNHHADVNARKSCFERTPLNEAIRWYDGTNEFARADFLPLIRFLVDRGADTSRKNGDGLTPLHLALQDRQRFARKDLLSLIEILFVHQKDRDGATALHYIVKTPPYDVEIVKLLLKLNADVNTQDYSGNTPLNGALQSYYHGGAIKKCFLGFFEIIQALLDYKTDLRVANQKAETPLHHAIRIRDEFLPQDIYSLVLLLLEHQADVNARDDNGDTPLRLAVAVPNDVNLIRLLLTHGADANIANFLGNIPLREAIKNCVSHSDDEHARAVFVEVVRILIEHQADVNVTDSEGDTPLHTIAKTPSFYLELGRLLLKKNANVNVKNRSGNTPLLEAIKCCDPDDVPERLQDFVRLLLDHGADASVDDIMGNVPLHEVLDQCEVTEDGVWYSWRKVMVLLLRHGKADPNARNRNGDTLLHRSLHSVYVDTCKLLTVFLDHHADINSRDTLGNTALHKAIHSQEESDLIDVFEFLLERGADASLTNNRGNTILHELMHELMLFNEDETALELLLDRGVAVDVPDANGNTPLALAVDRVLVKSATLLLQRGANMNIPNHNHVTPLLLACAKGRLTMIYLLIRSSPHHVRPQHWRLSIPDEHQKIQRSCSLLHDERNVRMKLDR